MHWWQILLYPFAIIYDIITRIRNWCYDVGLLSTAVFPQTRVVSIGNLAVGGTGKSPMVQYVVRWAENENIQVAILSRGYGRKTHGVRLVNSMDNAETVGDEVFGFYHFFDQKVPIVVAESRANGMRKLLESFPGIQLVVLDDAFQHRGINRDFNVVLSTAQNPFWQDHVLPSGKLRESRRGISRADHVILTKCPDLAGAEIYFPVLDGLRMPYSVTGTRYLPPQMESGEEKVRVFGISGLANNDYFKAYLEAEFELIEFFSFSDHHDYSTAELQSIVDKATGTGAMILTTYKDVVKLRELMSVMDASWGYVPIEVEFFKNEEGFKESLKQLVEGNVGK